MAQAKVTRVFADEYTGKRYAAGDTFRGTPERIEELRQRGVLVLEPAATNKAKNGQRESE